MSEHSPGSGQVLLLAEIGKQFLAVVGGALADPAATGAVTDEDTAMAYIKQLVTNSENVIDFNTHEARIFPEATNLDCVLTAHADANTWSAWVEIVDTAGSPVTLSSKFASQQGHITAMLVETANTSGAIYMAEIAYGDAKTIIGRHRILTETNQIPTAQVTRERGVHIPAGETIYYRGMCDNAGAKTVNVHFRYFLHS